MRASRTPLLLGTVGLASAALVVGCRTSGSWQPPAYPTSTSEIRSVIQEASTPIPNGPDAGAPGAGAPMESVAMASPGKGSSSSPATGAGSKNSTSGTGTSSSGSDSSGTSGGSSSNSSGSTGANSTGGGSSVAERFRADSGSGSGSTSSGTSGSGSTGSSGDALDERVRDLENDRNELLGSLSGVDEATRAGDRAPENVGSAIVQSLAEQQREIEAIRARIDLGELPEGYEPGSGGLAGDLEKLESRVDRGFIDLESDVSELKTVTSSLGEVPERLAETDLAVAELDQRVSGVERSGGGGGGSSKLPWYLAGGALGLASLFGLLVSRTGKSRSHEQVERLSNRLTDLDLRHRDLEEHTHRTRPIPMAQGLAGAAVLSVSDSPAAATQVDPTVSSSAKRSEAKVEETHETAVPTQPIRLPETKVEPVVTPEPVAKAPEVSAPELPEHDEIVPHSQNDLLTPVVGSDTNLSRDDFDRSLVERIQEQYLSSLDKGTQAAERGKQLTSAEAEFEASALDPPWKPLSPLTPEEEFRGRFETEAQQALDDLGEAGNEESPESDDEDSSFV